jgi:hypothetical protein
MSKKIYHNTPEYFTVIMYISLIVFLTSLALTYSCFHNKSFVYMPMGIVGLLFGIIGWIEFVSKKRIFPHGTYHWLRELIALILLALAVYILRTGSMSSDLLWREKMVCIILFAIGFHALHLRGFIKSEDKKE